MFWYIKCVLILNWIVWNRTICIEMDLALNNQKRLICHKIQPINQPLLSHKPSKTCQTQLDKQGQSHKWCSPMGFSTWTHWCWLTSISLHSSHLHGYWIPSRGLVKSDCRYRWMVRESKEYGLSEWLHDDKDKRKFSPVILCQVS